MVYIFENTKSNIIKVGFTDNLLVRFKSFVDICGYWKFRRGYYSENAYELEQLALKKLVEYRFKNPERGYSEFCDCSLDLAIKAVEKAINELNINHKVTIIDKFPYTSENEKVKKELENEWLPSKDKIFPSEELGLYRGKYFRPKNFQNEIDDLNN